MIYDYETFIYHEDVTKFLQKLEEDGIDPKQNVISISESIGQYNAKHFTVWYRKKDNNTKKDNKKKNL